MIDDQWQQNRETGKPTLYNQHKHVPKGHVSDKGNSSPRKSRNAAGPALSSEPRQHRQFAATILSLNGE